jgi:RNA polymerase sigma factor (sigma-70 family)
MMTKVFCPLLENAEEQDEAEAQSAGAKRVSAQATQKPRLTPREHQIIVLACEGLKNPEIGQQLDISESTVRDHLKRIFRKLKVPNRLKLIAYAYRHGLDRLCPEFHPHWLD